MMGADTGFGFLPQYYRKVQDLVEQVTNTTNNIAGRLFRFLCRHTTVGVGLIPPPIPEVSFNALYFMIDPRARYGTSSTE